ncbi:MAG: hypothetical protein AAF715_28405 [Myxococcota bacterium]
MNAPLSAARPAVTVAAAILVIGGLVQMATDDAPARTRLVDDDAPDIVDASPTFPFVAALRRAEPR